MARITVTTATAISATEPLALDEIAHACGAEIVLGGAARRGRHRAGARADDAEPDAGGSPAATCRARWRRAASSATSAWTSMPRR